MKLVLFRKERRFSVGVLTCVSQFLHDHCTHKCVEAFVAFFAACMRVVKCVLVRFGSAGSRKLQLKTMLPILVELGGVEGFFLDFVGFSEEILVGFFFALCGFFLPISRMHNVVCFLRPQSDDPFACVAKPFDAVNVSGRGCSAELVNAGCKSFSCHTIRLNHTIITQ